MLPHIIANVKALFHIQYVPSSVMQWLLLVFHLQKSVSHLFSWLHQLQELHTAKAHIKADRKTTTSKL